MVSFLALLISCVALLLLRPASSAPSSPTKPRSCFPPDLAALQAVAASFNSTLTPFFRTHWKPQLDCCSWVGVVCSSTSTSGVSRVVGLSLADSGVRGRLPHALCRLSALSSLDLSSNFTPTNPNALYGPIPACIGNNLTSLQRLLLSHSIFNSSLPDSFSRLFHLQVLDLSFNNISGSISPLANLSHLTYLDLSWNYFNGPLPFFNTPSLQHLDLNLNFFTGPLLPAITHTPSLQYLDVDLNSFSGSIPSFNTTPQVRTLVLSFNPWTGNIPALPHLLHLTKLRLDYTSVSAQGSSIAQLFCDLRSLEYLSIAGMLVPYDIYSTSHRSKYSDVDSQHGAISGTLDKQLRCERPSVNLTHLDLSSNNLMGPFPAWMGLFSNLQYLDLSANNFSGFIPQAEWKSLTQLTSLQLSSNLPSPDPLHRRLGDWLFRLPLQTLTLRSMGLTTEDLQCDTHLSLLNQTLKSLDLSDNDLPAGRSLWNCLAHRNFTSLSHLYLSNNPLAFNLSLSYAPISTRPLILLDLSYCQLFGNLTMELLSSAQGVYLAHNELSGSIPSQIGTLGPSIHWLDLSFNNLTGPIPASLGNFTFCKGIELNNNHLDGEIPTQEVHYQLLVLLLLGHNHFSRVSFQNNTEMPFLEILDLSFNKLEGNLQELFGDYSMLNGLSVLLLSHNQLSGSIPASFGRSAPYLTVIELSNNKLTGAIPGSLSLLPALRTSGSILEPMAAGFNLQSVKNVKFRGSLLLGYMDLSSNMLSGSIPPALGELLGLNDLNLSRNHLSGRIPPSLANLTHLESLDLSYNDLEGSIPTTLSQLSELEVFNVSFNPKLSGQIPGGPQLQSEDSYKGDPNLCGVQIHKDCNKSAHDEELNPTIHLHGVYNVLQRIEEWASIPGIGLGYALGIGLTVWALNRIKFYG